MEPIAACSLNTTTMPLVLLIFILAAQLVTGSPVRGLGSSFAKSAGGCSMANGTVSSIQPFDASLTSVCAEATGINLRAFAP